MSFESNSNYPFAACTRKRVVIHSRLEYRLFVGLVD